jgi:hypothetical protein
MMIKIKMWGMISGGGGLRKMKMRMIKKIQNHHHLLT